MALGRVEWARERMQDKHLGRNGNDHKSCAMSEGPARAFVSLSLLLPLLFLLVFFQSCKQSVRLGSGPLPPQEGTAGVAPSAVPVVTSAPDPKGTVATTKAPKSAETCCNFPLDVFPSYPFNDGSLRSFGSSRDGGTRKHAAADLYHIVGRPIYAIDDGEVLDSYFFYSNTYAVEVKHPKFIVRYGEIRKALASGVKIGSKVKAGQVIGYVGQMDCCRPMLHFEQFSGKASGPLTNQSKPPYFRRSDLINPTDQLLKWKSRLPKK